MSVRIKVRFAVGIDSISKYSSNLLILLSLDRVIPMNPVRLNILQDVFIEFSEVNFSTRRPSSESLISDKSLQAEALTLLNSIKTSCSISRQTGFVRIV